MRPSRRHWLAGLLLIGLHQAAAFAQSGGSYATTPLACDFKNAPPGSWAEYATRVEGGVTLRTRWAFLNRTADGNTVELTMSGPAAVLAPLGGKVVTRMLLVPDPVGVSKPIKQMVMQLGERDPIDVPLELPELPGQKFQNPDPKKLVARETITVAAGSFDTRHYREEWEGSTVDAWISDRVPPLGLIKTVVTPTAGAAGPGGKPMPPVTMELLSHGQNARPAITRAPRPFDPSGKK